LERDGGGRKGLVIWGRGEQRNVNRAMHVRVWLRFYFPAQVCAFISK
jgi:hypothetical protein